jgi:transposase-like protein
MGRLQALFTDWRQRSLKTEAVVFLYLDAIGLRVRIANKVVSAPVLVGLGVKADGQKVVLDLELLQSESSECWGGLVEGWLGVG